MNFEKATSKWNMMYMIHRHMMNQQNDAYDFKTMPNHAKNYQNTFMQLGARAHPTWLNLWDSV